MSTEQAAAYYASKYGTAAAALEALAGSWACTEDFKVRTLLEGMAYAENVAANAASGRTWVDGFREEQAREAAMQADRAARYAAQEAAKFQVAA